ncbi:MAG: transketolase [Pseudomonadota bacterium]
MKDSAWKPEVRRVAAGVRRRVLEHSILSGGGYLSQACSSADMLAVLYVKVMNLGPSAGPAIPGPFPGVPGPGNDGYFTGAAYNGPPAPDLDRFFLSPAHYALVLYAVLIETGRMAAEALEHFNRDGGSVEMIGAEHSPGMEVTAGSLGQAVSQAAGIAWARKRKGESGRVWIFLSDGEFQIGQTWEAVQTMSCYGLDNVGIYVDVNGHQCDGRVENVMGVEPLDKKLEAFGMSVFTVDGHDLEALAAPALRPRDGKPLVVLGRTNPCAGLPLLKANAPKFHYVRFKSDEELASYKKALEDMKEQAR